MFNHSLVFKFLVLFLLFNLFLKLLKKTEDSKWKISIAELIKEKRFLQLHPFFFDFDWIGVVPSTRGKEKQGVNSFEGGVTGLKNKKKRKGKKMPWRGRRHINHMEQYVMLQSRMQYFLSSRWKQSYVVALV